jgi:hypothetical protein
MQLGSRTTIIELAERAAGHLELKNRGRTVKTVIIIDMGSG